MFARKSRARLALGLFYGLLLLISLVVRAHRGSLEPLEPVESTADVLTVDGDRISWSAGSRRIPRAHARFTGVMWRRFFSSTGALDTRRNLGASRQSWRVTFAYWCRICRVSVRRRERCGTIHFAPTRHYVRQLLDHLGLRHVHVLGYSMGGGVALSLVDIAPERVASLTLVSAIGVQEMELTGDYYVNHFVHAAQLAALWVAREGIPHMGLLDRAMLGVPYTQTSSTPISGRCVVFCSELVFRR